MRRRTKRAPNTSESTGKIGQELPQNQQRPLVPSYMDEPLPVARSLGIKTPAAKIPESKVSEYKAPERKAPAAKAPEIKAPEKKASRGSFLRRAKAALSAPIRSSFAEKKGQRIELETQPDWPSLPTSELPPSDLSQQVPKGYVILAIGLPGSGKTTWFKRRGVTPLSSDLLRNILFDDVEEQRYQGLVFSTLRSLLRARLIAHMPWNYVDATNLSAHERRQWIKMSTSFGYEVQAVFFDVPLDVCLERNSKRDRNVNEEVMRKMSDRLKPPVFEEGFAKITVVRMKSAS